MMMFICQKMCSIFLLSSSFSLLSSGTNSGNMLVGIDLAFFLLKVDFYGDNIHELIKLKNVIFLSK